jgi:hypothetical protein
MHESDSAHHDEQDQQQLHQLLTKVGCTTRLSYRK